MQARDRKLSDWYGRIKKGEMKLPRFQRFEAWDRKRISSLLEMVIRDLPLGITLILDVGEKEKFISRFLETAPQASTRVYEQLLDGQQRLTALWRAFQNNYPGETYYVYLNEFDRLDRGTDREDMSICSHGRYIKKGGERYPLWCDSPADCLERGLIPTDLLRPEDVQDHIDHWIEQATAELRPKTDFAALERFMEMKKRVSDRIRDLRTTIYNYNLPFLSLPPETDKSVALDVFIKMNTNSKPLSQYDVIVAEIEDAMGESLHDLEAALAADHPEIGRYSELSDLILMTSALLQGQIPNQRGAWAMDKRVMMQKWPKMERGLKRMAGFLQAEGIFDEQRLPTSAVLAPIAAFYAEDIPESGDKLGRDELLLRTYLWRAFFTDRYENASATHAFADFNALKRVIRQEKKGDGTPYLAEDVPILGGYSLAEVEELMTAEWPKKASIRGRGILAVACRLGAFDFATGQQLGAGNINGRQYHHVYPDALLKEAGVESYLALNCALISDTTNASIGRKEPLQYLKDRYEWTSEDVVRGRLQSHLIPIPELANGGYENLSDSDRVEKIRRDFSAFIRRRGELIRKAVQCLTDGRQLSLSEIERQ